MGCKAQWAYCELSAGATARPGPLLWATLLSLPAAAQQWRPIFEWHLPGLERPLGALLSSSRGQLAGQSGHWAGAGAGAVARRPAPARLAARSGQRVQWARVDGLIDLLGGLAPAKGFEPGRAGPSGAQSLSRIAGPLNLACWPSSHSAEPATLGPKSHWPPPPPPARARPSARWPQMSCHPGQWSRPSVRAD